MLKVTQLYGFGGGGGNLGLKSASSYSGSSASSHSITMPSTFLVGDLLIASVTTNSNTTVSSFTGWTSILSDSFKKIYYKIAAGSDTATLVLSGSSVADASIAAYGPTSGVDGTPNGNQQSGDVTCSAITVTVAGGLLIAVSSTSDTVSTPSGFALDTLVTVTRNFYWFSKAISATGSTGTVLLDESGTAAHGGALIYVKP